MLLGTIYRTRSAGGNFGSRAVESQLEKSYRINVQEEDVIGKTIVIGKTCADGNRVLCLVWIRISIQLVGIVKDGVPGIKVNKKV